MSNMRVSQLIPHLEKFWLRQDQDEWVHNQTLLCGLNLGLQETLLYLNSAKPSLEQFEQWVLARNGGSLDPLLVDRLNDGIAGKLPSNDGSIEPVLTPEDLAFWEANGYVILHDAVPAADASAAAAAIYESLDAPPDDPDTWYRKKVGHTIWVPLMHHRVLYANRHSPRIHAAFAQIWGRTDLWVNTDQSGFNPPERHDWKFPGPYLHWDSSLALPLTFGTQGILYLTDTAADQGAFQCVPGFHHKLEAWLRDLPADADPRQQDLSAEAKPIAGRAGDLIIWHHQLPHGSSPNRAERPRVVQYLNLRPSQWDYNPVWK